MLAAAGHGTSEAAIGFPRSMRSDTTAGRDCNAAASRLDGSAGSHDFPDRPAERTIGGLYPLEMTMQLTIRSLLLIIAVILFLVAAFGVDVRGISLVALGLALFAAAFIVPDTIVGRR